MSIQAGRPRIVIALGAFVIVFTVVDVLLGEQATASALAEIGLNLAVALACAVAASGFARRDYLYRAWTAQSVGYLLLTVVRAGSLWTLPPGLELWMQQIPYALGNVSC